MNEEHRDLIVQRVQEAFAKWPSFDEMPVVDPSGLAGYEIEEDPEVERDYVAALYELSRKAVPVGRAEKADIIYGKYEK